jgi:hypothetical protein
MPNQSHGSNLWSESAGSGGVPAAVPAYFVKDGADWTISLVGPEQGAFVDVEQNGNYTFLDLTPVYITADGADFTINQVGPAAAILIDDGAGNPTLSTDLTETPIADLYYDPAGNLWLVRRTCPRLHAVQVSGNITFY